MLTVLWQTKNTVSFLLEDRHVVNEHYVIRKSHDATQKKCPHVMYFSVPRDWFQINSRHQKRYSEDGKKFRGCRGLLGRVINLAVFELLTCLLSAKQNENASTSCAFHENCQNTLYDDLL